MGILSALVVMLAVVVGLVWNQAASPPSLDYGTGSMFDVIAGRYDFVNRALALNMDLSWRRIMVSKLFEDVATTISERPLQFLDLATGTADVSILLAQTAAATESSPMSGIQIKGVDPSANMIAIGRDKVQNLQLENVIQLELGDARELKGIDTGSIHGITMAFGIRNVMEKDLVACEMHRVLTLKGTVAILEFSEPTLEDGGFVGYYLARPFIRHVVPWVGAILSGKPREYLHLQNSISHFPPPSEFTTFLESLSCPVAADDDSNQLKYHGRFRMKSVTQLNFGSVQLYLATPIITTTTTTTTNAKH